MRRRIEQWCRFATFLFAGSIATANAQHRTGEQNHFTLQLDPIPGLTSVAHSIPDDGIVPIPRATTITLRIKCASSSSNVQYDWQGARETSDAGGVSTAEFARANAGRWELRVTPIVGGIPASTWLIRVDVASVRPEEVRVVATTSTSDFATYVGNPFTLNAAADPPAFGEFIEWRATGCTPTEGFGRAFTARRDRPGYVTVTAGFLSTPDPPTLRIPVYEVHWTRMPTRRDYRSGPVVRLYHEVATTPPGLERFVHWTYDTLGTGEATPTTGTGKSFVVTRTCSFTGLVCFRVTSDYQSFTGDSSGGGVDTSPIERRGEQQPFLAASVACSLPVGLFNGEVTTEVTDLEVPSRGFPFVWRRQYSSLADFDAGLGFNWTWNYNRRIQVQANGDVSAATGRGHEDLFAAAGSNSYVSPAGHFDVLVPGVNSTFTQTDPAGMQYTFDAAGYLIEQRDRAGNTLQILRNAFHHPTQIIDTQGRCYLVTYTNGAANQRVASLVDFMGREVRYEYDADGNLVRVRSPIVVGTPTGNDFPDGKTTLYKYSTGFPDRRLNHNLLAIIDPQYNVNNDPGLSKPWVTLTYSTTTNAGAIDFDKVVSERWGNDQGGPPSSPNVVVGGTSHYAYADNLAGDAEAPAGAIRRTTEVDRDGNVTNHYFDVTRHELKTVERTNRDIRPGEGDYSTTRTFTLDGFESSILLPRGNSISYLYDTGNPLRLSQGNRLEVRRGSNGIGGGGGDLVTRYTYDPVFNQLRTVTDARAFPNGQVPLDAHGHLDLAHPLVARYTGTALFDYQEGAGFQSSMGVPTKEQIPEGLGDLNGAPDFDEGNVVRNESPAIQTAGPNLGDVAVTTTAYNDQGQPVATVDPEGHVTTFDYFLSNGTSCDATDKEGYLRTLVRDATGFHLGTQFDYDPAGNVVRILDAKGQSTDHDVNALNQVVRIRHRALSGGTRYEDRFFYDLNDEIIRAESSNHDENGALFPHASVLRLSEYNILHFLVSEERDRSANTDPGLSTVRTEFAYDANLHRIATIRPRGVSGLDARDVRTTLYDERGLPYRIVIGDGDADPANAPPADAVVRTLNYDANRNVLESIDAIRNARSPQAPTTSFPGSGGGDVTLHVYDGFDRRAATIDAEGDVHATLYDAASNAVGASVEGPIDEAGSTRRVLAEANVSVDEWNRVVVASRMHIDTRTGSAVGDGASTTTYEYDRESKVVAATDDRGNTTSVVWDTADRRSRRVDALGNDDELLYDANGNVVATVRRDISSDLGSGVGTFVTTMAYDALDRLIETVGPAGDVHEIALDSRDNVVRTSDGVRGSLHPGGPGNVVVYTYDALDRRVRTERQLTSNGRGDGAAAGSIVTTHTWDDDSRLVGQTDDNGHTTTYAWDYADRRTSTLHADGTSRGQTFDADAHLVAWIDANGTTCDQDLDGLGRVMARQVTRGAGVAGGTFEAFGYDGLSRVTRAENDDGISSGSMSCSFEYDSLSNVTRDDQMGFAVDSVFDGMSNRLNCTYPGDFVSGRRVVSRTYDSLNRTETIADADGVIAAYHYKGPRRVERRTYGSDAMPIAKLDCSYDAAARVTEMLHRTGADALVAGFQYGYDREDHRLFEKRLHEAGRGDVYVYDSIYRVIGNLQDVDLSAIGPGQEIDPHSYTSCDALEYDYDGAGNRASTVETVACAATTTIYTMKDTAPEYDFQVNQYTAVQEGSNAPRGIAYDRNGNMTSDGVRLYAYDFKNRLVEVREATTLALVAQYSYDAGGRRGMKIDHSSGSPVETHYLFDRHQVVEERTASGGVARHHVWGPGIDEILQEKTPSSTLYALETANGSVAALVDGAGIAVERYRYDPFGDTTVTMDGSTGNPYRFHGARFDPETGLYLMRARSYAPILGRFLQRDPIGEWSDDVNLGNGLAFVGNDAVNSRDPLGLWSLGSVLTSFARGVAVGLVTTVAVVAGAAALTALAVPAAVVTTLVAAVAVVGTAMTALDVGIAIREGDVDRVAYGIGTLGGGVLGARGSSAILPQGVTGKTAPGPSSWGREISLVYNPLHPEGGSGSWIGTGPTRWGENGWTVVAGGLGTFVGNTWLDHLPEAVMGTEEDIDGALGPGGSMDDSGSGQQDDDCLE